MLTKPIPVVYVATRSELLSKSYYRRLWMAARNTEVSRRQWLNEIADCLRDFDGLILYRSGRPFTVPDIDEIFGDDPDVRWLGYYLQASVGRNPKHYARKYKRLQLIDLYFRIRHPDIARHFAR